MSAASPQAQITRTLTGYWVGQALYVAAHLGLADLVKDGPRAPADLAAATGTHPPSLYRLLRALASVGVFAEDAGGRFGQTPLSDCLRSDRPDGQRDLALMNGEEHYRCWGELLYSVHPEGVTEVGVSEFALEAALLLFLDAASGLQRQANDQLQILIRHLHFRFWE